MKSRCHRLTITVLAALAWLALPAWAQPAGPVYRCGQAYQQAPCPAGKAVDVADARDPTVQGERSAAAVRDRALAKDLAAERHEREKAIKPQTHAAGIPVSPAGPKADGTASDNPCAKSGSHTKKKSKSKGKKQPRCVNGSPVYLAPGH
jgi:hypothetical protein